jgi:hypothetical protein
MNKKERETLAKKASYRYIQHQLGVLNAMVAILEERNRVLSMENDRLSAQVSAQTATPPIEETNTPPSLDSHSLYDPQPVQTLRYWIIKSRHDKEYFYLRSKENLVISPSFINDKLCLSGVTHATLVPEYLGLQMQLEYKGDFNLDFDVTIVENSVEEDETHVFFFYPLSVIGSFKNPEEIGARWSSMVKNFDRYGNANYRYREWGLVDGKKKLVFERVFPCVHPMPTLPM